MCGKIALGILWILILASPAHARDLTIYCEYPPPKAVIPGSKGGLIYDQVWELMQRTDITEPIKTVTWKRGYIEATSRPGIGLFPTTRTSEREDLFHWIGPILQVTWVLYAHADSGVVINSLEDAKKVGSIGTYANDGKEQWLKNNGFTNLVSVMDNLTNMKKLYDGRVDLMAGSPTVTDRWPALLGLDPSKLKVAFTFKTVDLYLAVSLGTDSETVDVLRSAFSAMSEDGTLDALYAKWVPGLTPPTPRQ